DNLSACRGAAVDELAHAPRDRPRLALTPAGARLAVCVLVADQQLDGVAEDRVCELARSRERLVAVAELVAEQVVDRREHLGPRAVVARERKTLCRRFAPLAEDRDVGMSEPVDRLEFVTDEKDVARAVTEQVDQVALQAVRVLELVDHDRAETKLLRLAHLLVVAEQVAREELQVLEVEGRLALLRGRVLGGEEIEQLLQQLAVARCQLLERG